MQDDDLLGGTVPGNSGDGAPVAATWDDIKRAALHCPVLHFAVTMADSGRASREEALMSVALFMSRDRASSIRRETERLMREPAYIVLPDRR